MAKAIFQTKTFTATVPKFPKDTSIKQNVSDGDTIRTEPSGTFGVRLLGVDSPESKFQLDGIFTSLSSDKWIKYFNNLFSSTYFKNLPEELREYLKTKIKDDPSGNQYKFAKETERKLEEEMARDMDELKKDSSSFELFLVFAYDILDRYGRFLGFINRSQLEGKRPLSYNERLLQMGLVTPYFIWPNINPFRKQSDPFSMKSLDPDEFWKFTNTDYSLRRAREWTKKNRENKVGVFAADPLQLLPFELRFLARQELPSRYVIDLESSTNVILKPTSYFNVKNIEDRLFIPYEYVPLFEKAGWKIN